MKCDKPNIKNLHRDVDSFTLAYIECAFWSSTDNATDSGGEPLDRNYNWTDLSAETLAKMVEDCAKFQAENNQHMSDYPTANAGHDFWLTRNGHGAGFWENDFGTEEECAALTKASKQFGEFNLYVGDDGNIYH